MNKKFKIVMAAAVICAGTCVFAREPKHHNQHDHNDGLALAAGIVNLVCKVINPQPVIVTPPPPPPPPPVVEYHYTTPPPQQIIIKKEPIVIRHKITPPPPPKNNHRGGHCK